MHVNEISISYEKVGAKTRFQTEAKCSSEMTYFGLFPMAFNAFYNNNKRPL